MIKILVNELPELVIQERRSWKPARPLKAFDQSDSKHLSLRRLLLRFQRILIFQLSGTVFDSYVDLTFWQFYVLRP
jgi:hypothetical protein